MSKKNGADDSPPHETVGMQFNIAPPTNKTYPLFPDDSNSTYSNTISQKRVTAECRVPQCQKNVVFAPAGDGDQASLYPASVPVMKGTTVDYSNLLEPVYRPDTDPWKYTYFMYPGMAGTTDGLCPDGKDRVGNCWTKVVVCSVDPGHFTMSRTGESCGSPACRHHWKGWAYRGAQRIRAHVCGYQQATNYPYPARHIVMSLDEAKRNKFLTDFGHDETILWKKLRAHFLKTAKSCGITGGAMVMHAYRVKPEIRKKFGGSGKIWDLIRGAVHNGAPLFDLVYWSPHVHIAGYGKMASVKGAGKGRAGSDFQYKMIRALNTEEDVESWAYYSLSHCALNPAKRGTNVSYFGVCAPNKLKLVWQQWYTEDLKCPVCGAAVVYDNPLFPRDFHLDTRTVATCRRLYAEYEVAGLGPPG